jgi:hypothetical protein
MNYLTNIYNTGVIVETHIFDTEEKAVEAFNAYLETLETIFEKAVCNYSCTPTQEEETKTKTNKTKNK